MTIGIERPSLRTAIASLGKRSWGGRLGANSAISCAAVLWLFGVVVAALAPGLLAPEDPATMAPSRVLEGPGETLFGTDQYGRSVYTLIVHGAGTAITIGFASTALALAIGGLIGLFSGYLGGAVDMIIGRLLDVLMAFPGVLMALIIAAALGPSLSNLILSVAVANVPGFARVMRGQVMTVRSRLYVEAARSSGFSQMRIVMNHVLPNSMAPMVVMSTVAVGTSIVLAASLSFLGMGPKSTVPDWGQLLAGGQPYLANAWWISTFAGLVLTLTVIAISLLGDWLRDRLDA